MRLKWQIKDLESYRKEIYEELTAIQCELSDHAKLIYILEKVKKLDSLDALTQLKQFLYCMCALVHHIQFGGLQDSQVKQLLELAEDLLKYNGIKPGRASISSLYGELRMVRSQIHLNNGEFWSSIWNQLIAEKLSGQEMPGGEAYQSSLLGIKSLRLGFSQIAFDHFLKVEEKLKSGRLFEQARICRIKILRLAGLKQEFNTLIQSTHGKSEKTAAFQLEVTWEEACFKTMDSSDLEILYQLVFIEKSHYQESYLLELYHLAWCYPNFRWMHRLPRLRTITRRQDFDFKKMGYFYRSAQIFDQIYDEKINELARLEKVEQLFRFADRFRTVDKELMFWLALSQWLAREKHFDYYRLTIERYRQLSLSLSYGRTTDALSFERDRSTQRIAQS